MAAVSNPYDLLKNRMESEQLLQEAKSKKKKKGKSKVANGADSTANPEPRPQPAMQPVDTADPQPRQTRHEVPKTSSERRPRHEEENMALEEACPALLRVATKDGRMSVWNDWILQVKAGDRSVHYRAPDGSLVNFHKALLDSGAFETTVAHCMRVPLHRANEQPLLAALLSSCLPGIHHMAQDLAATIADLSAAMRDSRRDVQDASVRAVKALMASLKAAAAAAPTDSAATPNLAAVEKQLAVKRGRLERALTSTSDLPQDAATNAVDVARLLAQKFAALCASGQPSVMGASAEMAALTGVLGQYLEASRASTGGRKQQGVHVQEIRYLDTQIEALRSKVEALESELQQHRAELKQQMQRRESLKQLQANPTNGASLADGTSASEYQQQLDCVVALESVVAAAAGAPHALAFIDPHEAKAVVDGALQDLVRTCVQAAQIQDKFMESLLNQLQFARERLQNLERLRHLNDPYSSSAGKPAADVAAMIESIKAQSLATHDAAHALDRIVVQQEGAIKPSAKDSVLRSQAMQVKQIVSQVVVRHHQLMQEANSPLPYLQAQSQVSSTANGAPQQWQMDDILRMAKGNGSERANGAPAPANARGAPARPTHEPAPVAPAPMHHAMAAVAAPPPAAQPVQPPMLAQYLPAGMPLAHGHGPASAPIAPEPSRNAPPPAFAPASRPMDPGAQRTLDSAQQSLARLQASLGIPITGSAPAPGGQAPGGGQSARSGRAGGRSGGRGGR